MIVRDEKVKKLPIMAESSRLDYTVYECSVKLIILGSWDYHATRLKLFTFKVRFNLHPDRRLRAASLGHEARENNK